MCCCVPPQRGLGGLECCLLLTDNLNLGTIPVWGPGSNTHIFIILRAFRWMVSPSAAALSFSPSSCYELMYCCPLFSPSWQLGAVSWCKQTFAKQGDALRSCSYSVFQAWPWLLHHCMVFLLVSSSSCSHPVSVSPFLPYHFGFSAMPTVPKPRQSPPTFRPEWVSWISKLWLLCRGFTEDLPVVSKTFIPDHNQISVFYWSFSTHNCKIASSDLDELQIPLWFHLVSVKELALIGIIFVSRLALLGFLQQDFKIILLFLS